MKGGVISRDFYLVGEKSYSYRLTSRYRNDQHSRIAITDRRLQRALQRFREVWKIKQLSRYRPVHHHLVNQQRRLSIDLDLARSILGEMAPHRNPFDTQGILVSGIAQQRFHFSVGRYGRVSNSITSLSKSIRPALHHDGHPLHHVDIRCCQPALLGQKAADFVRRQQTTDNNRQGRQNHTAIYDDQKRFLVELESSRICGLGAASLQTAAGDRLARFIELTQQGTFYDYLLERLSKLTGDTAMTRNEVKNRWLKDVLAKKKANSAGAEYPSEIEDCFRHWFPEVYSFIRETNKNGFEHCNLIRELQLAESKLVIHQVCENLRRDHPSMFILTLHDAIYSTENCIPTIQTQFKNTFEANEFCMSLKVNV